jgi:hypothetical protein
MFSSLFCKILISEHGQQMQPRNAGLSLQFTQTVAPVQKDFDDNMNMAILCQTPRLVCISPALIARLDTLYRLLRSSFTNCLLPRNPHVRPYPLKQLFSGVRLLRVQVSLSNMSATEMLAPGLGQHTAASHLRNSSLVQVSGSPAGSAAAGNMSPPQIAHTATPVTKPVKASTG